MVIDIVTCSGGPYYFWLLLANTSSGLSGYLKAERMMREPRIEAKEML